MKTFKILVALLVMAVFVTAGSALAGGDKPFYEDKLYQSEKSRIENPTQGVISQPLYEDRYEDFLYETDQGMSGRSVEKETDRFYGVESSWEFQG